MTWKKKTILVCFAFSLIFLLSILFLIFPLIKTIKTRSEEISTVKTKLAQLEERSNNIQDFKRQQEFQKNLSLFEKTLVDKDFPIEFINFLENIAKENQILIEIFSRPSEKDSLSFEVKIFGSPQNVFKFLDKLENSPFLIQFEKLSISKLEESELKKEEMKSLSSNDLKSIIFLKVQTK